ncbi:MAG: MBL fold metallo-hydrolase [Candidatus Diapherotrites archaeon]
MEAKKPKIKFFGHSFFQVSFGRVKFLIDPLVYNYSSKYVPLLNPTVSVDKLDGVDAIFITHEHLHHFDKKAIEEITRKNNCIVVGHHSVLNELKIAPNYLKPITNGSKFNLKGVDVTITSVHHPNAFYPVGYLLEKDGTSIFHAGDTQLIDKFIEKSPDVALFPIGGNNSMDLIDAVRATKSMKPKMVIPMHYNTFEHIKADAKDFALRINKSNVKTKPIILKPGKGFNL